MMEDMCRRACGSHGASLCASEVVRWQEAHHGKDSDLRSDSCELGAEVSGNVKPERQKNGKFLQISLHSTSKIYSKKKCHW